MKRAGRFKRARTGWPLPGPLWAGALIAAVAGIVVFLVVYRGMSGGGGNDSVPSAVETSPHVPGGEPFRGGPRAYLPVQSVDLGRVPFNKVVSGAFDLKNVGDATLRIEDVQIKVLEGC